MIGSRTIASRKGWRVVFGCGAALLALHVAAVDAAPRAAAKKAPAAVKPTPAPGRKPAPADDLYEGPVSAPAAKPVAPKPGADNFLSAPLSPGPKFADAWPSEPRKAERDLELTPEAENRAQAIAAYAEGQMADESGDPDRAIDAWKRATSLDPSNATLAVKVATELGKRNEPAEAIRVLKDTIAASPKEPAPYILLAQIYEKHLNKPDLAMQTAVKAMEAAPEQFSTWAAVYELHQLAGDKQKAGELIEKALARTSRNPGFWLDLGRYLMKVSLKDDGTASPEELKQMEIAYHKATELKPNDASVLTQMADFYVIARRNKEALEYYERAVKLNQAPRDEVTKNLREKYIRALVANDRKADAIPLLEQFARDPSQALRQDLFDLLGELYEQSGQVDKALDQYQRSLILDTNTPTNHFNLANMQLRAKRAADAVTTMEKARAKFPDRPDVTLGLALALSAAKRHGAALAMFAQVVEETKGRNDDMLDGEFYFKWGAAAEQAGQVDKAAEYLKKSITLNPDTPEAYNYLGYMWVDRGLNVEEAGQMIKRAVEMSPDNGAYLDSLGWYYFKVGKFEEAKKHLISALEKLPEGDAVVFEHAGDACEQLGQIKEAIGYWEDALKQKPDEPEKIQKKIDSARQRQAEQKK